MEVAAKAHEERESPKAEEMIFALGHLILIGW